MRRFLVVSLLSGALVSAASADIIVDDFSSVADPTPWPVVINTLTSVNINEGGLSSVLGGTRHSTIRATYLDTPGLDFVQAAIVPNFGMILDYSSTSGAAGDWTLMYNRNGAGLNADLRTVTDIMLDFGRFDFANGQPLPVVVTISDSLSSAMLMRSLTAPGPQSVGFAVGDFADIALIDLAHVQSISVFLDPALATDFRLSRVYGVPTPGSMALLAVGSLAFGLGRRRRI